MKAGWLLLLWSLAAPPARSLKLRQQDVVSGVYYVNMPKSTARRQRMEDYMHTLGWQPTRLDGIVLEASTTGAFSYQDKAQLKQAFGSWSCGGWAQDLCHPGDEVCCWGFTDAVEYTEHLIGGHPGGHPVRGTAYLASSAAKVVAMKEIQHQCSSNPAKCLPAVLLEDDARLQPDWLSRVEEATKVFGSEGFDIIKLFGIGQPGYSNCAEQCSPDSPDQCFQRDSSTGCRHWGCTALLVNPRAVDKILGVVEAYSKSVTGSLLTGAIARSSDVDRMRYDMDNWLTLSEGLNIFTAKPQFVYLDDEMNRNTTFNHQ